MMLADLGASVIKVEPPQGDETRRFGPPFVEGESTYFLSVNRGKRSVVLDLKQKPAQAIVQQLAGWADVLVHNFRPGDAQKLGVGWETLHALHPRLVYVCISGYGTRGDPACTQLPGYDLVIQGVGGIPSLTGAALGPPSKMATSVADLVAGLNAMGGALAALYQRQHTGEGQLVDISMQDGQLSMLTYLASSYLHTGASPQRLGNAHPSICPYETFAAADGYMNIACGNDRQFAALCGAVGQPAWATAADFATNAQRVQHRGSLVPLLQEVLRGASVATWVQRIQAAGVPCGPILSVPEALAHPQVAARGMHVQHAHASVGTAHSLGSCVGAAMRRQAQRPAPRLGEHSEEILRELLSYDAAAVQSLRRAAIINTDVPSRPPASPDGAPGGAAADRD